MTRILIALVLLATLAAIVAVGLTHAFDLAILQAVQVPHATWLDWIASAVTVGGDAFVTAGIAAGLFVARFRTRRPEALVPLAIAVVEVVELALKAIVPHAEPPAELSRGIAFVPTIHVPVPFAFPSGHVARSTFLLVITAVPPWLCLVLIAMMAVSRVYLAEHWPTDVIGGVLLGLAVAWAARLLGSRQR